MPIILRAIDDSDYSDSKHHGGGFMQRGGFDVEEVEVPVEEYARRLVLRASSDVAYRAWKPVEFVNLDERFYLYSDENKSIHLVRVNKKDMLGVTGNDDWRQDARKWIAENYEDDPLADVVLAKTLRNTETSRERR